MTQSYPCSVILAAHGSEAHEDSNQPLFELAEQLAATELFSCVTPAFLNGQPNAINVMDLLPPGDAVVVPIMTSDGYYLQHVLPNKLKENAHYDQFRVLVTPPIGMHPEISSLVADRVLAMTAAIGIAMEEATVVIVGHGTRKHPLSGKSTETLTTQVQELLPDASIKIAFIDQDPTMESVIAKLDKRHTLVVPFLMSRGPHATVDVPAAFGLPTGPDIEFPLIDLRDGQWTVCDLPVGMYPEMSDLCLDWIVDQLAAVKLT